MHKLFTTILLAFASATAMAQITILNADMPKANDTIRISNATGTVNVNQTGANYQWNFSNISIASQDVVKYKTGIQTPYAIYFATASYGIPEANSNLGTFVLQDVYGFYRNSSAAHVFVGRGASVQGLPLGINFNPRDTIYRFPLTYGKSDSGLFAGSFSLAGLGDVAIGGKRVNIVDGWGSITTPYGTFDCIRVKSTINETDTIKLGGFPIPVPNNRIEYKWLAKGQGYPVFQVVVTQGITGTQTITFKDRYRPELFVSNARFSASKTTTQIGDTINLTDQSLGSPTAWQWNITPASFRFVAGTNASSENPRVIFDANASYSIKLTVNYSGGSDDTLRSNYISVVPGVVANFGSDRTQTDPSTVVNFFDSSSGNPTSYNWSFNPNTVSFVGGTSATSKNPKVVFNASGNYSVTLKATGSVGSNSITKANYIAVWPTGINNNPELNSLNLYPNPVNDYLNIQSQLLIKSIRVIEVSGKEILHINNLNLKETNLNVGELNAGIYFAEITLEKGKILRRFIKQ